MPDLEYSVRGFIYVGRNEPLAQFGMDVWIDSFNDAEAHCREMRKMAREEMAGIKSTWRVWVVCRRKAGVGGSL